MHNRDNLNRFFSPNIADDVGVKVPEAIAAVRKLLVVVADAGRLTQLLKGFINLRPKALGGVGTVLSDLEKDCAEIGFRFRNRTKRRFTNGRRSSWRAGVPRSVRVT